MPPRPTLYPIEAPPPGRVSTMPRPRGDDWLDDELSVLRVDRGVDVLVCLMTGAERDEFGLADEPTAAVRAGMEFHALPIPDLGVPDREPAERLLTVLARRYAEGGHIAFHCRHGIGRASLMAAALLERVGIKPAEAWDVIAAARGRPVPETEEQRRWLSM